MGRISSRLGAAVRRGARGSFNLRNRLTKLGIAAAWLRFDLVFVALAAYHDLQEILGTVRGRRLAGILCLAAAFSLGILEYKAYAPWEKTIAGSHAGRIAGSGSNGVGEIAADAAQSAADPDETPKENARMEIWRKGVEEALKNAEAPEQAGASPDATQQQPETAIDPFANSPVIDGPGKHGDNGAAGTDGPIGVIPFVRPDEAPFERMRAQAWGRRFSRTRHFRWWEGYPYHVAGVARAGR